MKKLMILLLALMLIGAACAEASLPVATIEMESGGVISMARAMDPDSAPAASSSSCTPTAPSWTANTPPSAR